MNAGDRTLVAAAVALGAGDGSLRTALQAAASENSVTAVEEMLLQSYLFIGYPRTLQAFRTWRDVESGRGSHEARALQPAEGSLESWAQRGMNVLERVYGTQHEKLLANARALNADLAEWMVVEGYGKVLGRAGLPLATRELCIIALLATQDALPQLYSHLRGALHAGATEEDVEETLLLAIAGESESRRSAATEVWRAVRERRRG